MRSNTVRRVGVAVGVGVARRNLSVGNNVRSYLDTMIGQPSNATNAATQQASSSSNQTQPTTTPLSLTASSFMFPTLRVDRSDTPEKLSNRISEAVQGFSYASSMLQGKLTQGGRWVVPIALDLGALAPDGSPHYVPPEPGRLKSTVDVLSEYSITVVGLVNVPKVLEEEAIKGLGLPSLTPKGQAIGNAMTAALKLDDIINLVVEKSENDFTAADEGDLIKENEVLRRQLAGMQEEQLQLSKPDEKARGRKGGEKKISLSDLLLPKLKELAKNEGIEVEGLKKDEIVEHLRDKSFTFVTD